MSTLGDDNGIEVEYADGDEDVPAPVVESLTAVRTSPTAIAAFVSGFLGLFVTPSALQTSIIRFEGGSRGVVLRAFSVVIPLVLAGLAWWLSGEADGEIKEAGGRLGGVGFFRAARVASYIIPIIVVAGVIAGFFGGSGRSFGP
jgi:hypothetical protein